MLKKLDNIKNAQTISKNEQNKVNGGHPGNCVFACSTDMDGRCCARWDGTLGCCLGGECY